MDLSNALSSECVQIGGEVTDKQSVLELIAELARRNPSLSGLSEETILGALKDRETLGSTGFQDGIAIPHCVLDQISEFVVGILVLPDGVDFDSLDGERTRIFVFIIGPSSQRSRHISVLATISRVFRITGALQELLLESNPAELRERFLRYSQEHVDTQEHVESCLFHVCVQNEDKFSDILQVFAAVEGCSVAILDAKDAGSFLHTLPLFSSFWDDDASDFCRVIVAVVKKAFSNDTIRQINDIAGGLDKQSGILVAVGDLVYAAGELNS